MAFFAFRLGGKNIRYGYIGLWHIFCPDAFKQILKLMKKVLTVVLMAILVAFGSEAALAKDHDHGKCKDKRHGKTKVVYVDKKHRSYDDCRHCNSRYDKKHSHKGKAYGHRHDDRDRRYDDRWKDSRDRRSDGRWDNDRDYDRRDRTADVRRDDPSSRRDRNHDLAKVILEERHRSGNRR